MDTRKIILAYDDDPARYDRLAELCARSGWMLVTLEHPDALAQVLRHHRDSVLAILLDHDLRDVEGETSTGVQVASGVLAEVAHPSGVWPDNVGGCPPVIVTSANRAGAARIASVLSTASIQHAVIPVTETSPEERWYGLLCLWSLGK